MNSEPPVKRSALANTSATASSMQDEQLALQGADPVQTEWYWWHLLLLLSLLGPILAPVLSASGIAPFTTAANIIYWLGNLISPSPHTAITLFGEPMAVPPLGYSALIAITICALSYPSPLRFWTRLERFPWYWRFGLILLLIIPWLLFCRLDDGHASQLLQLIMLFVGFVGGIGIALLGHMLGALLAKPAMISEK
ncbi:MAG TPA: hypothetical protein VFU32_05715 [Ktedonobacterales bacterium]|nr:hypothetical protein [Ktedonobacterales bacterium]